MSLKVWLPLNRDLKNHGLVNMNITSSNVAFNNYALSTGNIIMDAATTNQVLNNDAASIAFWMYVNAEPGSTSSNVALFGNTSTEPVANNRRYSIFQYPTVNDLHWDWRNSESSSTNIGAVKSGFFESYTWTHCVLTYNRKKREFCIYKNGIQVRKDTNVFQFTSPTYAFDTYIIHNATDRYIYDFRIYDHTLSKKEVAELARGCVLHYPMNDVNSQILENVFNYPTFDTSSSSGGWQHWPYTGSTGGGNQNSNKLYIFNKNNSYSHEVVCTSGERYLLYQVPEYSGSYRSAQAIIKMKDESIPDSTKVYWAWNANVGSIPKTQYIPLGDNFYLMKCEGFRQDGSNDLVGIYVTVGNTVYVSEAYLENDKQVCSNILSSTHGSPNLNTANWASYTPYWTIESQTLNEIKLKQVNGQTVALVNHDIWPYLSLDTPVTVSGYLYKGDSPYQTSASVLSNFSNICTVISRESRADGYFRFTVKYTTLSDSAMIVHSYGLFGLDNQPGDICYIRNMEWHITPYLKDVSGFNNHSLITGSLPLATTPKSPRYDKCMNIDNSGTNKNYANCTIAAPQVKSASFWVYIGDSIPSGRPVLFADKASRLLFGFYNAAYMITSEGAEDQSDQIPCAFYFDYIKYNSWNHFVLNHFSSYTRLFVNGTEMTNPFDEFYTHHSNNFMFGARDHYGVIQAYWSNKVSDFRLFSHVLTQADVDDLYKDSLSIDKSQNGYCYELNESDAQSSVDVKKNGQLKCKNYFEADVNTYDNNIYSEPDGSQWIRIFHHNNPANALFSSSDTFTTGVYKDADRWFKVSLCNNVSKWELMVKQKLTSTSEQTKYRWIQYKNPMSAVFGDVDAADVIKYTSSQGYTDIASYMGGIYKMNSNTYIVQNNSTNGNWFGAIGCWTAYNGGIPSSGHNSTITDGCVDLYLRIDNLDKEELASLFTEGEQIARLGKTGVTMNEIHEV